MIDVIVGKELGESLYVMSVESRREALDRGFSRRIGFAARGRGGEGRPDDGRA